MRPADKRKRKKNDDPADIEGFLGPWGGYVDEKRIIKPTEEEAAELEEILAKRNKRGKETTETPIEERTVLHSKFETKSQVEKKVIILQTLRLHEFN